MSTTIIDKNNPKRWVLVQDNNIGINSFKCFGNIGEIGVVQLATNQPRVKTYMTEDEVEVEVNTITSDSNYYRNAVETSSPLFTGISGKYPPIDNE